MKNRSRKTDIFLYFLPPIITIGAILIIYFVKGQYPFGNGTMIDTDWGVADFPGLVRFWDIFRSNDSLFFDWSTAGGIGKNGFGSLFDPFNYFLLLFKRDFLFYAMNYFFILKMAVISITSFVFYKKTFPKISVFYNLIFTFGFTFSGYCLQYYTNIGWLSFIAIVPLIALATIKMLKGNGFVSFVLLLAWGFVISVYFSAFVLEMLILVGGAFIFAFVEKPNRAHSAFKLGIGTVCAFLISTAVSVISLNTIFSSSRMNNTLSGSGLLDSIKEVLLFQNFIVSYKFVLFFGLELAVAVLFFFAVKCKKDKKAFFFFLYSTIVFVLPVFFMNIDLILHGGSYNGYPMRYGFVIALIINSAAAYYLTKFDDKNEPEKSLLAKYIKPAICVVAMYVAVPIYIVMIKPLMNTTSMSNLGTMQAQLTFIKTSVAFLAISVTIVLILLLKNKKVRMAFICVLMSFVIGMNAYVLIGAREMEGLDYTEQYIVDGNAVKKDISSLDPLDRISSPTYELFYNAAMITERSSISDWSHLVKNDMRKSFQDIGYSLWYTTISSSEATVFSNALMNVNNAVSSEKLNESLYTQQKELENDLTYYSINYSIPVGLMLSEDALSVKFETNTCEFQNEIYKKITQSDNELFSFVELADKKYESYETEKSSNVDESYTIKTTEYKTSFTAHVGKKSVLYFMFDDDAAIEDEDYRVTKCVIRVNGEKLTIPAVGGKDNKNYRISGNSNVLTIGTFENEDVEITLTSLNENIDKPVLYTMPLEKMEQFCASTSSCITSYEAGSRSLSIKAEGESGKYLFIPVYNDSEWQCTVNGEKKEISNVFGSFMAIPLDDGDNKIEIKYVPSRFYMLLAISVVSLIVFAVVMLIIRRKKPSVPKLIEKMFLIAFTACFAAAIAIFYLIPLGFQVYKLIMYLM